MKRIIASAGLAAVGVASVQAAYTPGLTPMEQAKPWSVSVAVRGFYDDNMFARPKDSAAGKQESWGVSVNPTVGLNFALERTLITFDFSYDFRWFEARENNEADHIIKADVGVSHAFSERLEAEIWDKFTYAQEGAVRVDQGAVVVPGRSDGDYFNNKAYAGLDIGATERLVVGVSYLNDIWDYENSGTDSYSALLDRMVHTPGIEVGYLVQPTTTVGIGYKYADSASRSTDLVTMVGGPVASDTRNARTHSIYAGVEHDFNPQLDLALRGGVQLVDYYNAGQLTSVPGGNYKDDDTLPYIDLKLGWNYNPGSYLNLGVMNTVSATSLGTSQSQNNTGVYLDWNHRITPKWTLGALGLYQYSSLIGGTWDGENEQLLVAGVNVKYLITKNLTAEAGYNYDLLSSDVEDGAGNDLRGYDRNRVYLGLRAIF